MSESYKSAGVDKEEGYKTVDKIKSAVAATHNPNVLNHLGSFGAFYKLSDYQNPILVSGTDGVGTKLRIALDTETYNTVGIDCFAMCANDILCHGAKPLFFLDYLACGKLDAEIAAEMVLGMTQACQETQCALIGGETAEMPGMYAQGDYDIAGFCVGVVEEKDLIDGRKIQAGDTVFGLLSSGFHSNGFSLIRKVFTDYYETFEGEPIYKTLLQPTRLYHTVIHAFLDSVSINGLAHITGGGLIENVPRILPDGLGVQISYDALPIPSIMKVLQERGNISQDEMLGTFNMGIGMTLIVSPEQTESLQKLASEMNEPLIELGNVLEQSDKIIIK